MRIRFSTILGRPLTYRARGSSFFIYTYSLRKAQISHQNKIVSTWVCSTAFASYSLFPSLFSFFPSFNFNSFQIKQSGKTYNQWYFCQILPEIRNLELKLTAVCLFFLFLFFWFFLLRQPWKLQINLMRHVFNITILL